MHQRRNSCAILSVLALLLGLQPQLLHAQAEPAAPAPAPVVSVPAVPAPVVPVPAVPSPAPKAEGEGTADGALAARPPRANSLFLTPEQLQRVQAAVQKYRQLQAQRAKARPAQPPGQQQARRPAQNPNAKPNAKDPDDYLTALTRKPVTNQEAPEAPYLYPQFYMDFLMFHTPSNWVAMINGKRFAAEDVAPKGAALKVVSVERERVFVEWKPDNMKRVRASWGVEPNPEVQVDYAKGIVRFPLRQNQTFSSYLMRVVEGRVTPVKSSAELDETADLAPRPAAPRPGNKPAKAKAQPSPAKAAAKPAAAGQKTGLNGLLNNYRNLENKP